MDDSAARISIGACLLLLSVEPAFERGSGVGLTRPTLRAFHQATYLMFHFVEGVPFESNSGVYDRLTMWEQIDGGAQYTPAKKWLTSLPIMLCVLDLL